VFVNIRGLPGAHYWYRENYTRKRKKIKLPCEQLWLCRETTLNVMLKNILLRWVFNKSVLFWRQILWNFPIVFALLGNTPFPTLPLLPSKDEKKLKSFINLVTILFSRHVKSAFQSFWIKITCNLIQWITKWQVLWIWFLSDPNRNKFPNLMYFNQNKVT
jgi:hypothetical protein